MYTNLPCSNNQLCYIFTPMCICQGTEIWMLYPVGKEQAPNLLCLILSLPMVYHYCQGQIERTYGILVGFPKKNAKTIPAILWLFHRACRGSNCMLYPVGRWCQCQQFQPGVFFITTETVSNWRGRGSRSGDGWNVERGTLNGSLAWECEQRKVMAETCCKKTHHVRQVFNQTWLEV